MCNFGKLLTKKIFCNCLIGIIDSDSMVQYLPPNFYTLNCYAFQFVDKF